MRFRLLVFPLFALASCMIAGVTPANANANAITVHGPKRNLYHTYFNETVSGFAGGAANYVISGEQLYPAGGCSALYLTESKRSDWYRWPTGTGPVRGPFTLVARFWARNHNEHGICTYLINSKTEQTYAHAGLFWNNS